MSKSVSTFYPFASTTITVYNNKYITFNALNGIMNLPKNVLKQFFTKDKMVERIPNHNKEDSYIHLKHVKEYIITLGWDEQVEVAMQQLGYVEDAEHHSNNKRERTPDLRENVDQVISLANMYIQEQGKQPLNFKLNMNQELDKAEQRVGKRRVDEPAVRQLEPEVVNVAAELSAEPKVPLSHQLPPPSAAAAAAALPDKAKRIIDMCREHNLAKAMIVYMASDEYKMRVANAIAARKDRITQQLRDEMHRQNYQKWYDELYAKEYDAVKQAVVEKRETVMQVEVQRLLAKMVAKTR